MPSPKTTPKAKTVRLRKAALTCDRDVERLATRPRPYKKFTGGVHRGLYVEVNPATELRPEGTKLWRVRVEFAGKDRRVAIGRWPDVSFEQAVIARAQTLADVAAGTDPTAAKHVRVAEVRRKQERAGSKMRKVEPICRGWIASRSGRWTEGQSKRVTQRLERWIFPRLGDRDVDTIDAGDLLDVLELIRGKDAAALGETQHRCCAYVRSALQWAVLRRHITRIPDLTTAALDPKPRAKAHPAPTRASEVGALLALTDDSGATPAVAAALKLLPRVFTRPGELRMARWEDFDLESKHPTWTFEMPKFRTKEKPRDLVVPLSKQAVEIIEGVRLHTGGGRSEYLFPSLRSVHRPLSENTIVAAYRNLGIGPDVLNGHSWRAIARTRLVEDLGFSAHLAELQLGHSKPGLGNTYDRTEFLAERREMLQAWADYLDRLRDAHRLQRGGAAA